MFSAVHDGALCNEFHSALVACFKILLKSLTTTYCLNNLKRPGSERYLQKSEYLVFWLFALLLFD
jgi:hypothetical protein